jgi:hypothetical protein
MIRYKSEDLHWYQMVYLKTDENQYPWMLVGIILSPNGPMFTISRDGDVIDVYEGEISTEINTELKLGIENHLD